MNYFTPELYVMGQSEDDAVLDEQERLWEEAGDRYVAYLEPLRAAFPRGLRRLDARYYLHDAHICEIATRGHYFSIRLQLDTPPRSLLDLRYRLLWPHVLQTEVLPSQYRETGPGMSWMYDEIARLSRVQVADRSHDWIDRRWYDLVRGHEGGEEAVEWPFWQHSILLGKGWELTLAFRDVEVEEWTPVAVPHSPYSAQRRHA